jgi:ATP-dependent DNA ligase
MPTTFVAFDVLSVDGAAVMQLPLSRRRELLAELVPVDSERLIRSRAFESAVALFEQARTLQLEGVVYKRDDSIYVPGPARSRDWIKIKTEHGLLEEKRRQETWGHGSRT